MKRRLLLLLLTSWPTIAAAQNDSVANLASTAQRVRVVAPTLSPRPIVGRVSSLDSQVVALRLTRLGSILEVPFREITTLAASGGIDRASGARRGAAVGLAVGGLLFVDAHREVREEDGFGLGAVVLGVVAFGITPAIGALAGYGLAPERWSPLEIPPGRAAAPGAVRLRLATHEDVRLETIRGKRSGSVQSQSADRVTLSTRDGLVPVIWSDVTRISVRGDPSRGRGALRGAIIITGITAIGIATDPLPTALENAGVVLSNAAFGALIGAFFPMRSWMDLPVPRGDGFR